MADLEEVTLPLGTSEGGPDPSAIRYAIAAAVKTIDVLFAFAGTERGLSIAEAAARSGTTKNQAYRCLKSLEMAGLVQEDRGGFVLTTRILQLASAVHRPTLLAAAEGELQRLRHETGETANLFALTGPRELICLATLQGIHAIGLMARPGLVAGLHAGAVPKAVLAFLPSIQREQILAELPGLVRSTPRTEANPERLRVELEETVKRGFSVSDEDVEEGARGVGAPIFGPDGYPVGGLSVGGPSNRLDMEALRQFGPLVQAAALRVSRRLGYTPRQG